MGRHDSRVPPTPLAPEDQDAPPDAPRRRATWVLLVTALAVCTALVVTLGIVWVRSMSAPTASPTANCEARELTVRADPSIAPALEQIVAERDDTDAQCLTVTIVSEPSADTASVLAAGAPDPFDVWVPESAMWVDRANAVSEAAGGADVGLRVGDPLASTAIVLAASEATAAAIDPATVAWSSIAARALGAILPDPARVAASSAGLLAIQTTVPGGDPRAFTAAVLALARAATPDTDEALAALDDAALGDSADAASADTLSATTPTVAITTEQAVVAHNAEGGSQLVALYPKDLRPAQSFPLVVRSGSGASTATVTWFEKAVRAGTDVLADFGIRSASGVGQLPTEALGVDGAATSELVGSSPSTPPVAIQLVDGAAQAEAAKTWALLTAPSRMLSVNDVSGSMNDLVAPGQRRIDLFEQAAIAAVREMSPNSQLATWVFSTRRVGAQDWLELVPFGTLGDPAFLDRTITAIDGMDRQVGGGTGLYDTVLAAVTYMHQNYDPTMVNSVLLNTDGRNEDDDSIDLDTLIAQLKAMDDPTRPVPVIAVGYGPDTDQAALQAIATATGGAAYQTTQPSEISAVLLDAITMRTCRPRCS